MSDSTADGETLAWERLRAQGLNVTALHDGVVDGRHEGSQGSQERGGAVEADDGPVSGGGGPVGGGSGAELLSRGVCAAVGGGFATGGFGTVAATAHKGHKRLSRGALPVHAVITTAATSAGAVSSGATEAATSEAPAPVSVAGEAQAAAAVASAAATAASAAVAPAAVALVDRSETRLGPWLQREMRRLVAAARVAKNDTLRPLPTSAEGLFFEVSIALLVAYILCAITAPYQY